MLDTPLLDPGLQLRLRRGSPHGARPSGDGLLHPSVPGLGLRYGLIAGNDVCRRCPAQERMAVPLRSPAWYRRSYGRLAFHSRQNDRRAYQLCKAHLIEDHVWVTAHCSILKGTVLRKDTVMATRSVTSREYERGSVVMGGSPARILRENTTWTGEGATEGTSPRVLEVAVRSGDAKAVPACRGSGRREVFEGQNYCLTALMPKPVAKLRKSGRLRVSTLGSWARTHDTKAATARRATTLPIRPPHPTGSN